MPPEPAGHAAQKAAAWKYATILSAELKLTREIGLAVYGKKSIPVWYFFAPIMFVMEAIRKGEFIRTFLQASSLPRELAIGAALDLNSGKDKEALLARIEEPVRKWQSELGIGTPGLFQKQMEEISLQLEHYSRLLNADGDTYDALVRNAYADREQYEVYLKQLRSVGRAAFQEYAEILGDNEELIGKIQSAQQWSEKLGEQRANETFSR